MRTRTLPEIAFDLQRLDEITVLELLELNSEELVNRCLDLIEEHADRLDKELGEADDDGCYQG